MAGNQRCVTSLIKTVGWDYDQAGIVATVAFELPMGASPCSTFCRAARSPFLR